MEEYHDECKYCKQYKDYWCLAWNVPAKPDDVIDQC